METGELTAADLDEADWKCPFGHDEKGKVKNDLSPNNSSVLQRSLERGTSTRKWDDSSGKIKPKRVRDPALVELRTTAVPLPHTVNVVLDHLGNTVSNMPFSMSAHHLIPSDASLPKSSLRHYVQGGPVIESDIGYGVNGAENGVWLPTHQALSQDMPILPFETEQKKYADISDEGSDLVGSTISFYVDEVMKKTSRQFHDAHQGYSNFSPRDEGFLDILDYPFIEGVDSWLLGARFDAPIPEPLDLKWDPATQGMKKSYYNLTIPLMTRSLASTLRSSGVDNFDEYAVRIRDAASGLVDESYVAVNVLGVVAAADLSQSRYQDPSGLGRADMDFDSLVISPEAARGLLFFRLAECVTGLVVHMAVRDALEARGGFGLSFIDPKQWIG